MYSLVIKPLNIGCRVQTIAAAMKNHWTAVKRASNFAVGVFIHNIVLYNIYYLYKTKLTSVV